VIRHDRTIRIGTHRGKPRLWLEGAWLAQAGFVRGTTYTFTIRNGVAHLRVDPNGSRRVSGKVKAGTPVPVIDINAHDLTPLAGDAIVDVAAGHLTVKGR
jgi:DNA (cytosine-5)-methyltransferase 1